MSFISIDANLDDVWKEISNEQLLDEVINRAYRDWPTFLKFFEEELEYRNLKIVPIEEAN